MVQNKGVIFKEVPKEWPVPGKHLTVEARDIDLDQAPPAGGLIIKNLYSSFDPYMRGRMREPEKKSYSPPFTLGEPITSNQVSKVVKSDSPDFKAGDLVHGTLEY